MGGFEKTTAQKKANFSAANFSSQKAIQKKAVSVIQKAGAEEELQQHKSDGTVQKAEAPAMEEEHPLGVTQHKISQKIPVNEIPTQRKENKTGMPNNLKAGIENLSGMKMDHVRVHYNSSQPAQLNALAYAQGSDIHVAPGQEKHLPHEAWHVVQQAQGRVQPTTQMKTGVPVNDDPGLEHEADVMGEKAASNITQQANLSQLQKEGVIIQEKNLKINTNTLSQSSNIQLRTAIEIHNESRLPHEARIDSIVHDRVDMTGTQKSFARQEWPRSAGEIPARAVCNHHVPYKIIRDNIIEVLRGRPLNDIVGKLDEQGIGVNGYDDGYERSDINGALDHVIGAIANTKENLFYWPETTGDGGGTEIDLPAYNGAWQPNYAHLRERLEGGQSNIRENIERLKR